MGQARQRGTREERIATAKPKVPKPSRAQVKAGVQAAMVAGLMQIGTVIMGGTMAAMDRRARSRGAADVPAHDAHVDASGSALGHTVEDLPTTRACVDESAA